jgi:L-asparaginase
LETQSVRGRVAFISAGGTYSAVGRHRLDAEYAESGLPDLTGEEVLRRVPEVEQFADIDSFDFEMERADIGADVVWLQLANCVYQLWESGAYCGIIIGHGTNHLEETAYFLHLALPRDINLVIFGAMRAATALSTDADVSLLNAVEVVSEAADDHRGVLVVMNHEIYESESVTKLWTTRVDAFGSFYGGPVGLVQPHDGIRWLSPPSERPGVAFDLEGITMLPRVELVLSHAIADGALISAMVETGAVGLVSAAAGSGRPTPVEERAMVRARSRGVVVCQASRVPGAYVARTARLRHLGFVAAGWLSPWKAGILLSLALLRNSNVPDIQGIFAMEQGGDGVRVE